jgi:hypothetical protein
MMMMKNLVMFCGAVLASVIFFSCTEDEKSARLQVWLTDAPGDYEAVSIEVESVEIHTSENETENGWQPLQITQGVYNLLELTNGIDTLLGEITLPAGKISQIRLKLGDNNSLKVDGTEYALSTPSGQQSGLKLQVHETLSEGITYKILLDFDVARSIVQTGSGQYKLKPVIRTITEAQDGAIRGIVDPIASTPAVYAILGTDTLGTTYSDSTGHFLIRGLAAGTYDVAFSPNGDYLTTEKEGVVVTTGQITDVGTVLINE